MIENDALLLQPEQGRSRPLGSDSFDEPIFAGDVLFVQSRNILSPNLVVGEVTLFQQARFPGLVETPENMERLEERVRVELLSQDQWIIVPDGVHEEPGRWREIQEHLHRHYGQEDNYPNPPPPRDGLQRHPGYPDSSTTFLSEVALTGEEVRLRSRNWFGDIHENIDLNVGSGKVGEYIGTYVEMEENGEKRAYIVLSRISTTTEKQITSGLRLKEGEALAALQKDFPWFEAEDLHNEFVRGYVAHDGNGMVGDKDKRRLSAVYGERLVQEIGVNNPLNSEELIYLAGRNYGRAIQMAHYIAEVSRHDDVEPLTGRFVNDRLKEMEPGERWLEVLDLLAGVEEEAEHLLKPRWQKEREVLGFMLDEPFSSFVDRFYSVKTADTDSIGLHIYGLSNIIISDLRGRSTIELLIRGKEPGTFVDKEERRQKILRSMAEVVAHENGHAIGLYRRTPKVDGTVPLFGSISQRIEGSGKKANSLPRKEIWTDWIAVLWPRSLSHESPTLMSAYQYKPGTRERGGAWELFDMINGLTQRAEIEQLKVDIDGTLVQVTRQLVEQSALATVYARQEKGVIREEGLVTLGFADLYDQTRRSTEASFAARLAGCEDGAYASDDRLGKNQGVATQTQGEQIDIHVRKNRENQAMKRLLTALTPLIKKKINESGAGSRE